MNLQLRTLLDFLAATPGARPAVVFCLVWVVISPRTTAAVLALLVVTHMLWINP